MGLIAVPASENLASALMGLERGSYRSQKYPGSFSEDLTSTIVQNKTKQKCLNYKSNT